MEAMMSASKYMTKPGQYGTLYLYEVTYSDDQRDGQPSYTGTQRVWRYSLEHVHDAFHDAPDADGWYIVKASRVHA
jgi:hypothetical protein